VKGLTISEDNYLSFREEQKFSWRLCLVLVCSVVAAVVIIVSILAMQDSVDASVFVTAILGGIVAPIAIVALFLLTNLETEVHSDRLRVRLFPFHIRHRETPIEDLSQCYARTYKPIREYGGWGIRCGFRKGSGKAYNMKGNQGVQLVFKNGKRLLIGSQKPDELAEAISSIMESS
jgi:hypothetical protein